MADPASPEGMLRSYYGKNDTGLSTIREKPVDDRSVFQQTRDYLNKGINEDARDALGPHAAPALIGLGSLLGEIFGPGADVRDAVTASGETTQAVKEGDILVAIVGMVQVHKEYIEVQMLIQIKLQQYSLSLEEQFF